jgi:hypothetical protein
MFNEENNIKYLPKELWTYFMRSLDYFIAYKYKNEAVKNTQVWINIPKEKVKWIEIEQLNKSIIFNRKEFIGLDFDNESSIIANGSYWNDKIKENMEMKINGEKDGNQYYEGRNIYIFDIKMEIIMFYINESDSIMIIDEKSIIK